MPEQSSTLDDGFGHWLAGFIDGEGCFTITRHNRQPDGRANYGCHFAIALRADDCDVLNEICSRTGIGKVWSRKAYDYEKHPQMVWRIMGKQDALGLVAILDRYPLRAKKARDYAIWREALREWSTVRSPGVQHNWTRMAELKEALQGGRRFDGPFPPALAPREPALTLWQHDGNG